MRSVTVGQTYVCLPCLLKTGATTRSSIRTQGTRRSTLAPDAICGYATFLPTTANKRPERDSKRDVAFTKPIRRSNTSSTTEPVRLNNTQIGYLGRLHKFNRKLSEGLADIPKDKSSPNGVPIDTILTVVKPRLTGSENGFVETLEKVYAGRSFEDVYKDLSIVTEHRRSSLSAVKDEHAIEVLGKLGVIKRKGKKEAKSKISNAKNEENIASKRATMRRRAALRAKARKEALPSKPAPKARMIMSTPKAVAEPLATSQSKLKHTQSGRQKARPSDDGTTIVHAPPDAKRVDGSSIAMLPIEKEATLPVPKLSFDLSRVLFNPGVYQLQDPRSRVYNFDPYLEKIMPVSEFNFEALNPYITSSEDNHLRNVSLKHEKRYIGSSSSMSGIMSHFHFLLSAWRPLNMSLLSQQIERSRRFTVITRAPSGIFLRWRDGVYAVDADKQHDTPNVLMMQGKSLEKLLTLEKDDFEKYRKPKAGEQAPAIDADPESYHYSACENFLLRSQLDAWDPRLPGTGMFDLKTRACAGIRMDMGNHERGMGYQIKDRFGAWESFEREYFDMMRSAFLKYSLQVRMGRMDGIFVAYHNIERIFGFQYVSQEELDLGLHGQADPCLGDQEFKITVKFINEIFDLATQEYPQQSLRFVFETRDSTAGHPNGVMRVFAEPVSEAKINEIQKAGKEKMDKYERNMAGGTQTVQTLKGEHKVETSVQSKLSQSTLESNAADTSFLEEIFGTSSDDSLESAAPETSTAPVAGWELSIFNEVNGQAVIRPQDLLPTDQWDVKYELTRLGDEQARGLYNACQNRRAAALTWDLESKKDNFFIQRIRQLSEDGRLWRDEQNHLDAQRERVVLYGAASSS